MPAHKGIEIEKIETNSLAKHAGLLPGDILLTINNSPLYDAIDFMFHQHNDLLDIVFFRDGKKERVQIITEDTGNLGIMVKPFKVKLCKNNCIFCFVKQLPKGLRKSLYLKDEDYRLSFLYGNYMTLSNINEEEKQRIINQRLSPLYLSVHTTNKELRDRMLGNLNSLDIMKELKFFAGHKIRMHTQIVLCPGYNDGKELHNTIRDLCKLYPYVSSIAVVPVGLTIHRRQQLSPVTKEDASAALDIVEAFQTRLKKRHGDPVVYCADEMYIKAGRHFPAIREYGVLPQLENGVGLVPLFLSQARKIKIPTVMPRTKRFLTFTGTSFHPFLKKFIDRLTEKTAVHLDLMRVENHFFGPAVSVTGLLTGRDILKAVHDVTEHYDVLLVPDVSLKEDEDIFLDNVTLSELEEATGLKTLRTEATAQGLIDTIESLRVLSS